VWRHSWSVKRCRLAPDHASVARSASLPLITDTARQDHRTPTEAHCRRAQHLAERRGDRWPPIAASGALGLPDVPADSRRAERPPSATDRSPRSAGPRRRRAHTEPVLELQRGEQLLGLLEYCDTSARLLVVRRQLDSADRIARDEPPRRARRPAVDRAHDRNEIRDAGPPEPFLAEPVDPQLPVDLGQLRGVVTTELGTMRVRSVRS
jgi:hypothetical protein